MPGCNQPFFSPRAADRTEFRPVSRACRRELVTAVVPVMLRTQVTAEYDPDGAGRHLANLRRGWA